MLIIKLWKIAIVVIVVLLIDALNVSLILLKISTIKVRKKSSKLEVLKILHLKKFEKIIEKLSLRIQKIDEYCKIIDQKTEIIILKIKDFQTRAFKHIQLKRQEYLYTLRMNQKALIIAKARESQEECKESPIDALFSNGVTKKQSSSHFEMFNKNPNALSIPQNLNQLMLLNPTDYIDILAKRYSLFLESHYDSITTVVISKDNKYLVSGSLDETIRVWDIQEKREKTTLQGHSRSINSIALTSDNKYIVSASNDKTLIIWDLQEQKDKLF